METYTFLRALADSWVLLIMFVFFIGVVIWAFRPGSRKVHHETANMIFRNDDRPARAAGPDATTRDGERTDRKEAH